MSNVDIPAPPHPVRSPTTSSSSSSSSSAGNSAKRPTALDPNVPQISNCQLYCIQAHRGDCFILTFDETKIPPPVIRPSDNGKPPEPVTTSKAWLVDGGYGNKWMLRAGEMEAANMFRYLFHALDVLNIKFLDKIIVTHNGSFEYDSPMSFMTAFVIRVPSLTNSPSTRCVTSDLDHVNGIILLLLSLFDSPEEREAMRKNMPGYRKTKPKKAVKDPTAFEPDKKPKPRRPADNAAPEDDGSGEINGDDDAGDDGNEGGEDDDDEDDDDEATDVNGQPSDHTTHDPGNSTTPPATDSSSSSSAMMVNLDPLDGDFYSWEKGKENRASDKSKLPISEIWFNDLGSRLRFADSLELTARLALASSNSSTDGTGGNAATDPATHAASPTADTSSVQLPENLQNIATNQYAMGSNGNTARILSKKQWIERLLLSFYQIAHPEPPVTTSNSSSTADTGSSTGHSAAAAAATGTSTTGSDHLPAPSPSPVAAPTRPTFDKSAFNILNISFEARSNVPDSRVAAQSSTHDTKAPFRMIGPQDTTLKLSASQKFKGKAKITPKSFMRKVDTWMLSTAWEYKGDSDSDGEKKKRRKSRGSASKKKRSSTAASAGVTTPNTGNTSLDPADNNTTPGTAHGQNAPTMTDTSSDGAAGGGASGVQPVIDPATSTGAASALPPTFSEDLAQEHLAELLVKFRSADTFGDGAEDEFGENSASIVFEFFGATRDQPSTSQNPANSSTSNNSDRAQTHHNILFTGDTGGSDLVKGYEKFPVAATTSSDASNRDGGPDHSSSDSTTTNSTNNRAGVADSSSAPANATAAESANSGRHFDIIKITHHGTSRNNCFNTEKKYQETFLPFFKAYHAAKYIISSESVGASDSNNPDSVVLRAIVRAHQDLELSAPILYMTNGCSPIGYYMLTFDATTDFSPVVKFLKRGPDPGLVNVTEFDEGENTGWLRILKATEHYAYFDRFYDGFRDWINAKANDDIGDDGNPVKSTADIMLDEAFTYQIGTKTAAQLEKEAKAARKRSNALARGLPPKKRKTKSEGIHDDRELPAWMNIPPGRYAPRRLVQNSASSTITLSSSTDTAQTSSDPSDGTTVDLFRSFAASAAGSLSPRFSPTMSDTNTGPHPRALRRLARATAAAAPVTPGPHLHDILTSGGIDPTLIGDNSDSEWPALDSPVQNLDQITGGANCSWVGMAALLDYLESTLPVDPFFVSIAKSLLLPSPTGEGPEILLSTFLAVLFDRVVASNFICQLPINANGSSWSINDQEPRVVPVILKLQIKNFRAAIPNFKSPQFMVPAIIFEVHEPPSELVKSTFQDTFKWTIPFMDDEWGLGHATIQHNKPLEVKIISPFQEDRISICRFAGELILTRVAQSTKYTVTGRMLANGDQPATYDLQLKGTDGRAGLPVVELIDLLSPLKYGKTSLFESILASSVKALLVPGVEAIKSALTSEIQLEDAGIMLRQTRFGFSAVSIEDVYGTLDIKDAVSSMLNIVGAAIGLPDSCRVPRDLVPDLTLGMHNLTTVMSGNLDVSLSSSWMINGLGTMILQCSRASATTSRLDLEVLCQRDVTVARLFGSTLLSALGLAGDRVFLSTAQSFVAALDTLRVPFACISFAADSKGISLASYRLTVQVDDLNLGPLSLSRTTLMFAKPAGKNRPLSVHGTATMKIGDVDAVCSFEVDHSEELLDSLVQSSESAVIVGSTANTVRISLTFPQTRPSIRTILSSLLDAVGGGNILSNVPDELDSIFDAVEFQIVTITLSKPAKSWNLSSIYLALNLESPAGAFDIFGAPFQFGLLALQIAVSSPMNANSRVFLAQLSTSLRVAGCDMYMSLNLTYGAQLRLPTTQKASTLSFTLNVASGKLLFIDAFVHFMQDMTDIIGADVSGNIEMILGPFFPPALVRELKSLSLDSLVITVSNQPDSKGVSKYRVSLFEAAISSAISWRPWALLRNFRVENLYLRVTYDTGIRPMGHAAGLKQCGLDFTCTAYFGETALATSISLNRLVDGKNVTMDWSLSVLNNEPTSIAKLSLGDLITSCATDIGLDLSAIRDSVNTLLTIDLNSLSVSYTTSPDATSVTFSQQGNETIILGIPVTYISIICAKFGDDAWTWTVALEAPEFRNPLAHLFPLLDLVEVENLYVAFWKGRCDSSVSTVASTPNSTSFMVAGTLLFGNNAFLQVIKGMLGGEPSIDFCVSQDTFMVEKTIGSSPLSFFGLFTLLGFRLEVDKDGFAVGGRMRLDAQWLSKDETNPALPRRPEFSFDVIAHNTGALGIRLGITSLNQPFGIPKLEVENLDVMVVVLVAEATLESLAIKGTLKIQGTDMFASIDLAVHAVLQPTDHVYLDIEKLTLFKMVDAITGGKLPPALGTIADVVHFEKLHLKLELYKAGAFELNAKLYFFGFHAQILANVDPTPGPGAGVVFGASLDKIDIFGIVRINSFSNDHEGPFIYLNTKIQDLIKTPQAPEELAISDANKAESFGSPFFMTGQLVFMGLKFGIYGSINVQKPGIDLIVHGQEDISTIPGVHVRPGVTTTIHIDLKTFSLRDEWSLSLSIELPSVNIMGLSVGSINIPAFDVSCATTYQVTYSGTDWMHDGLVFKVDVHADVPLINLNVTESIAIPLTLQSFNDLPDVIEAFFVNKIASEISNIGNAIEHGFEKAKEAAIDTAVMLNTAFNIAGQEVLAAFVGAFYDVERGLEIAGHVAAEALGYSTHEVAVAFTELGISAVDIANTLTDVYEATAPEVASALIFAGHNTEIAFESAFNEGAGALVHGVDIVGSNITSGIVDGGIAIAGFVEHDIGGNIKDAADVVAGGLTDAAGHAVNALGVAVKGAEDFFTGRLFGL